MRDEGKQLLRDWQYIGTFHDDPRSVATTLMGAGVPRIITSFVERGTNSREIILMIARDIGEPLDDPDGRFLGASFADCAAQMQPYVKRLFKDKEINSPTKITLYALADVLSVLGESESAAFFEMAISGNVSTKAIETAVRLVRDT